MWAFKKDESTSITIKDTYIYKDIILYLYN